MRKQFLAVKLHEAEENGREEEANEIQAIMKGENQRRNWRSIDREMGKTRTPAPTMVETVVEDRKVTQHHTKDSVERAIHNEIGPRFSRAGSAPIYNGPLFKLLGCNADTEAGIEILEGTFKPPKGTDPATVIILNEILRIWRLMGDGEISIIITKEALEKDERTHSVIVLGTSLWSLRSRGSLGPSLRGTRPTPGTYH